jgi:hypothetical protein
MVRKGALTLGAVLMLGASGARAQDLSAFGVAAPSLAGVLPNLPQNWSDLPIQFKMSEGVGYNSNVTNTPSQSIGVNLLLGHEVGAFEWVSNYQASTKWYIAGEQFFADGSFGFNRYLNHTNLNTTHNSADVGVNWIYTSKCSGRLIASEQTSESEPGQQVSITAINSLTTVAFNETATCVIRGNYSAIFNSGTTTSTNSAAADKLNNFQSEFIAAGMSYTVSDTNSLQVLATITGTDYTNRPLIFNGSTLARNITTDSLNATYTKNIEPNLSLVASVGVIGVRDAGFNLALPSGWEPEYSLSVTWSITPKLGLTASVARTVAPPTSIIANLQVSESANLGVTYQLTPKVSLSAGANVGHTSSAFTTTGINVLGQRQNENLYGARASVSYAMTPFLGASLSYQYNRTVQAGGLVTPTSVALMTVNYAPY